MVLWKNWQVNGILILILGSAHLSMSTLNALRLTMRGCDMIALANLFLVFPVMQVRLRVGWGVVVCQRRSLSRQFCCCVEGKSACMFSWVETWAGGRALFFLHPGERSSLKVLSQQVGRSWTFWQLPSATLSRRSADEGRAGMKKGLDLSDTRWKLRKLCPAFCSGSTFQVIGWTNS